MLSSPTAPRYGSQVTNSIPSTNAEVGLECLQMSLCHIPAKRRLGLQGSRGTNPAHRAQMAATEIFLRVVNMGSCFSASNQNITHLNWKIGFRAFAKNLAQISVFLVLEFNLSPVNPGCFSRPHPHFQLGHLGHRVMISPRELVAYLVPRPLRPST